MSVSDEIHNYMETLVDQVLEKEGYVTRYDKNLLSDLSCIALNQLKPVYIRYDIDFLVAIPAEKLLDLKKQAHIAIGSAEALMTERSPIRK